MSDTETIIKERAEARARVEIITPSKNNPVAEYFSLSNTPETDAVVKDSNGQWSFVLKETCQRLERECDAARELEAELKRIIASHCDEQLRLVFENRGLRQELDEAIEKAERYRMEANAMMLQRDDARKEIEHLKDMYRTVSTF